MDAPDTRIDLIRLAGAAVWLSVGLFLPLCVDPAISPALTAALYFLFGAAFWIATGPSLRTAFAWVLGLLVVQSLCAIWLLHIHAYFMMTGLLVITGWQVAMQLPVAVAVAWIATQTIVGALLLSSTLGVPLLVSSTGTVFGFQIFAIACADVSRRERQTRLARDEALHQLRCAQTELLAREREEERLRIARDLHDDIGHGLTAIGLMAAMAELDPVPSASRQQVAAIKGEASAMLAQLRSTVSGLRSGPRDDGDAIDLAKALVALREQAKWPFEISVSAGGDLAGVGTETGVTIIRLIREAIVNAARHAGDDASRVDISLEIGPEAINLAVSDDGCGSAAPRFGNGLSGMRERVEALGGNLELRTSPGKGFTVTAILPRAAAA